MGSSHVVSLSCLQQQIFNQLEFLGNDYHPDAHACRLKLSVVTVGLGEETTMKCPWSVAEEMEEYAKKHAFVSSACRLTTEEEMLLLQLCSPGERGRLSLILLNRKAFVTAVSSLATLPQDKSLTVKLGTERPPSIDNFDIGPDTTILDNPKKTMLTSKLFGAAYSRPEEVRSSMSIITCPNRRPFHAIISNFPIFCRIKWLTEG